MLWSEEALQFDEAPSLSTMYSQLPIALNLLKQLEMERAELLDKDLLEKASQMQSYMVDLVNILNKKWDHTTQQILQHVDMYARETTENFQIEGEQDGFKFGLWANTTKNPRYLIETNGFFNAIIMPQTQTCGISKHIHVLHGRQTFSFG